MTISRVFLFVACQLLVTSNLVAAISIFNVNGNAPGDISPTRNNFLAAAGPFQDLNWDSTPAGNIAGTLFSSQGIQFTTPGSGFRVDPNFGFPGDLQTFSASNLFASVGSNISNFTFVAPGGGAASTNAFGVIFVDAEGPDVTRVELFDLNNSLLSSTVVATGANASLSFFGAVATAGERIGRVQITTPLNFVVNGGRDNEAIDFVVMDNISFGNVTAVPEPSSLLTLGLMGLAMTLTRLKRSR